MKKRFKIVEAEVGAWTTRFVIQDLDHENQENRMSAQAFFHHLGYLAGTKGEGIEGLEFSVEMEEGKQRGLDPLELCGKIMR